LLIQVGRTRRSATAGCRQPHLGRLPVATERITRLVGPSWKRSTPNGDLESLRPCASRRGTVNGTKLHANASHCNLDYEQIAREILKKAADVDAAEDELLGDARGDELPPEFQSTGELRKRLRGGQAAPGRQARRRAESCPALTPATPPGSRAAP